jgi:hypothetical protein
LPAVGQWARYEQDVSGAFDKSGACSVGLLEPLKFIEKLIVDRRKRGVPTRVRREAIMKQIETAQILDVKMVGEVASQLRCGEEVEVHVDMAAVTKLDFAPVSAIILFKVTRLLNRIYEDSRGAANRAHGFDTLNFSTCPSRRSAIIRHIKINGLSEPYNGKMVSSSQLLN